MPPSSPPRTPSASARNNNNNNNTVTQSSSNIIKSHNDDGSPTRPSTAHTPRTGGILSPRLGGAQQNTNSNNKNGNTSAHRRAVKRAEARALECAATPLLLSLADRRLRTQTRSVSSTILGTTFQSNLPQGLALYQEMVNAVHLMGTFQTSYGQQLQQQQQYHNNIPTGSSMMMMGTNRTPTPPVGASTVPPLAPSSPTPQQQQQHQNVTDENVNVDATRAAATTSPNADTTIGPDSSAGTFHHFQNQNQNQQQLPFGILPTDAPMIAQGKILEAWASFLGGETRRIFKEQAQLRKSTTAKIANQVETSRRLHHDETGALQKRENRSASQSPHRVQTPNNLSNSNNNNLSPEARRRYSGSIMGNNNNNNELLQEPSSSSIDKTNNNIQQQQQSTLLCEIAQDGVEYPAVILRALEAEESERNPKAELELYVKHYENVLRRGEASNEGTIRELEVSVFVTLTQSLLSLVQLATMPKIVQQQQQQQQQQSMMMMSGSRPQSSASFHNNNKDGRYSIMSNSRNQHQFNRPSSSTSQRGGGKMSPTPQQQQQQQHQSTFYSSTAHAALHQQQHHSSRPDSATTTSSSLHTMARPNSARTPSVMLMMNNNNNNNNNNNTNTNTPHPPPSSSLSHHTTTNSSSFSPQQHEQHEQDDSNNNNNDTSTMMTISMPIARVVCRPNSARHLTAARKAPKGLDNVCTSARLAGEVASGNREAFSSEQQQQQQHHHQYQYHSSPSPHRNADQQLEDDDDGDYEGNSSTENKKKQNRNTGGGGGVTYDNKSGNGRVPLDTLWKGNVTEAQVGVGAAARHVQPTTNTNWSFKGETTSSSTTMKSNNNNNFGHQSFKRHLAKADPSRPRHGKALQTEAVTNRMNDIDDNDHDENNHDVQDDQQQQRRRVVNNPSSGRRGPLVRSNVSTISSMIHRAQSGSGVLRPNAAGATHQRGPANTNTNASSRPLTAATASSVPMSWNKARDEKWVIVDQ